MARLHRSGVVDFGHSISVPGTSIRLDTTEAVDKWIADRKRRYPLASKESARAPARPTPTSMHARPPPPSLPTLHPSRIERPVEADLPPRPTLTYGRGRGRGAPASRGGPSTPAGRGANATPLPPRPTLIPARTVPAAMTNLGGYETGEASSDEGPPEVITAPRVPSPVVQSSDEEAPEELKIEKRAPSPVPSGRPNKRARVAEKSKSKQVGKQRKVRSSRFAAVMFRLIVCTGLYTTSTETASAYRTSSAWPPRQGAVTSRLQLTAYLTRAQLLAMEIEHDMSDLAQVVDFLVANDFLRDVELRPGEGDEREIVREL